MEQFLTKEVIDADKSALGCTEKEQVISTQNIYDVTRRISNNLRINFGVNNPYNRMFFTACALVAQRYGARLESLKGRDFSILNGHIISTINKYLEDSKQQNMHLHILKDVYQKIEMPCTENQKAINDFIDDVCIISDCVNSDAWHGEDIISIFFNEFNRYRKKSELGQVFTPEHITSFMYRLINVTQNDYLGDFTCGSGVFLVKGMSNMMHEAGGQDTDKAKEIRKSHLFGIEFDKEIYALACANMLIHKDGEINIEQNDMRTSSACEWIKSKPITKVLMNPPYENKYGCMTIVENVLNSVKAGIDCAFILPDRKLENASKAQIKRILENHTLTKIIKLPEPLFFGVGVTTSIFVFKTGQPQNGKEIFGCYIEDDGFETVRGKGRQDIKHKWKAIEDYWIDSISKLRDTKYNTAQWINPKEHLSYQTHLEIDTTPTYEDFKKVVADYLAWKVSAICKKQYSYGKQYRKGSYLETIIPLPVIENVNPNHEYTVDDIDWEYMRDRITELERNCITELERDRITELDAYLQATGLNDYELTEDDKKILSLSAKRASDENGTLEDNSEDEVRFEKFALGGEAGLFNIYSPKKRFNANTITFGGKYPYVARGSSNNGIRGYITEDEKYLSPAKSLSFGQDTATVYYQPDAYFTGDKIKVMVLNNRELTPELAEYFIATIARAFSTFAWGQSSFNENIIKSMKIELPIKSDGTPDFEYMERYIRAMEKVVIADVVKYKDKVIETTKKVVYG